MKKKATLRDILKRSKALLPFLKPYWKNYVVIMALTLVTILLSLVLPLILRVLIDDVLVKQNLALLNVLMVGLLVITIVSTLGSLGLRYLTSWVANMIAFDLRNAVFEHLEYADMSFLHRNKLGDILTRLSEDVGLILQFVLILFDAVIMNVISGVFILAISLYLSVPVTLLSLLAIPFFIMVQVHYGRRMRKSNKKVRRAASSILSFLQEKLSEMTVVRLFTRERDELNKIKHIGKNYVSESMNLIVLGNYASGFASFIAFLGTFSILWFGGYQVVSGAITVGSLIAIYTYVSRLYGPIQSLAGAYTQLQVTSVSVDRVFDILQKIPQVVDSPSAKKLTSVEGAITFSQVSFRYKELPILKDINMVIQPKETVGIVGRSGSGKTTLTNLLLRFYDPQQGSVLVDGQDIRGVTIRSLRSHLGVVPQTTMLFDASLFENIRYAKPSATLREVQHAARLAGIHGFIMTLPQRYQTKIGERGSRLSGGQRQRIAIARVFLKKPEILIFDEATSSLDKETERHITKTIQYLKGKHTLIIIAHQLSTMRKCDRILVLDKHRIAEQGTFAELMKKKGVFWNLYKEEIKI